MSMDTTTKVIDLSKSSTDFDIYDHMAGGDYFMSMFAGGNLYSGGFILPQTNPKSIFKNYAISSAAQMAGLQEDYVKYALMPLQIEEYLSDKEIRVISQTIVNAVNSYLKHTGGRGSSDISSSTSNDSYGYDLDSIAKEMQQDSVAENIAEAVAMASYGPIGAMIAGAVVGGLLGTGTNLGANVAEHAVATFSGLVSSKAIAGITSSLGITSTLGVMAVGMVVASIVSRAVEVALGLNRGFGFGGGLVDSSYGLMSAKYAPMLSIAEKVGMMLGTVNINVNFTTNILGYINSVTTFGAEGQVNTHDIAGAYGNDPSLGMGENTSDIAGLSSLDSLSMGYFSAQLADIGLSNDLGSGDNGDGGYGSDGYGDNDTGNSDSNNGGEEGGDGSNDNGDNGAGAGDGGDGGGDGGDGGDGGNGGDGGDGGNGGDGGGGRGGGDGGGGDGGGD